MIIPNGFEKYKQFIVYELRKKANGKTDKVPVDPITKEPINHLASKNQLSADDAIVYAQSLGDGYGVGFVFTNDDPFFFIDIDSAYDGQDWSDVAQDIINKTAGAFVEVSQSGTGLHIFGTGELPDDHANKNTELGLELYTRDRFVALTGTSASGDATQYINGPLKEVVGQYFQRKEVAANVEWTDKPRDDWDGIEDDDELIERMLATKPSATQAFFGRASVADLFNRNVEVLAENYPDDEREFDESSADAALAQHLAFWTGCNGERMLRIMWRSALQRDKWKKHRNYLRMTILSAISRQKDVYKKGGKTVKLSVDEWLDRIEKEAADAKLVAKLVSDLKYADLPMVARDVVHSKLADVTKMAGHGVSKTSLKNATQADRDDLITFPDIKSTGKPKTTIENLIALINYYNINVRYNLMSKEVEILIPGSTSTVDNAEIKAVAELRSLCQRHDLAASAVDDYIRAIADSNAYNPPREWILSKPWDGVDRLPELVATLGAVPSPIYATLLKRYLISGCVALFDPKGVNAGGMIVLQGPQYAGKTRWLRRLFGKAEWFKEGAILNPHDKDSVMQSVSRWGVELGELDATFRKSDIAALKGFLTKDEDEFRLPYERRSNKFPRRTIFSGSVNPKQYLHDDTGNRRFWTIETTERLNPDHDVDIQQVWAQAYQYYLDGVRHFLTKEENQMLNDHNEKYSSLSFWDERILTAYDFDDNQPGRPMTITEIAKELGESKPQRKDLTEIGRAVRKYLNVECRKSNGKLLYDMPRLLAAKIF